MKTLHKPVSGTVVILFCLACLSVTTGCQKNLEYETNNTVPLLDSVISDNGYWPGISIHYVYDGQQRVVEERVNYQDTLRTRRTYEYQDNDPQPFKMNSYKGSSAGPDFSSVFQYNSAGQKVYDSTYALPGSLFTGYTVVRLSYSVPGKIVIMQETYPAAFNITDTVFLNTGGSLDSVYSVSQYQYRAFSQFSSHQNVLSTLSISACRFYSTGPNYAAQLETGYIHSSIEDIILEYFSKNNYQLQSGHYGYSYIPYTVQYEYQYNAFNLPVSEKRTYNIPTNPWVMNTRFVYR